MKQETNPQELTSGESPNEPGRFARLLGQIFGFCEGVYDLFEKSDPDNIFPSVGGYHSGWSSD